MTIGRRKWLAAAALLAAASVGRGVTPAGAEAPAGNPGGVVPETVSTPAASSPALSSSAAEAFRAFATPSAGNQDSGARSQESATPAAATGPPTGNTVQQAGGSGQPTTGAVQPAAAVKRLPKIGAMPVADERISRPCAQPLALPGQFEHVVTTFDAQQAMRPMPDTWVPPAAQAPEENLWNYYQGQNDRWWATLDYLRWRVRGYDTPTLVTQSPGNTPLGVAGRLPDAEALFGDDRLADGYRNGGRIRLGWWTVDGQFVGYQGEYFGFETKNSDFFASQPSTGSILARPFFNTAIGQEDAALLSGIGLSLDGFTYDVDGQISVSSQSNIHNLGVIRRHVLWADFERNFRFDWLIGYRFFRLDEDLGVTDLLTLNNPSGGFLPAGTLVRRIDEFDAKNDFHAGEVGLMYEVHRSRWSLEGQTKVALGNVHQSMNISGSTAIDPGGVFGFIDVPGSGGFLAQPGLNAGRQTRDELALLTESELKLVYRLTDTWRLTAGGNLIYMNRVARAGGGIDRNVNPSFFPTQPPGAGTGPPAPNPSFPQSYFWLVGFNLGAEARW